MTGDFRRLIPVLAEAGVDFILVGGMAGVVHGAARVTYDVDVVYDRGPANLARLAAALAPHSPYPRGAPVGLPFSFDERSLRGGLNFTLTTALGDLDLFGEIAGGGTFADLLPHSTVVEIAGAGVRCVTLPKLIALKRAAGRPKDFEAIAELTALLEEGERRQP
jgi:predicted nucleotidyltransferase